MKKEHVIEGLVILAILILIAAGLATHNHSLKRYHISPSISNTNNP